MFSFLRRFRTQYRQRATGGHRSHRAGFVPRLEPLEARELLSAAPLPAPGVRTLFGLTSDHPRGSVYGQEDVFTATVRGANPAGAPAGSVQFRIDGKDDGPAQALSAK